MQLDLSRIGEQKKSVHKGMPENRGRTVSADIPYICGNQTAVIQMCPPGNGGIPQKIKKKFAPAEDDYLIRVVQAHGDNDWNAIAADMGTGKTARQCRERWKHYLSPSLGNHPWTVEEDDRLEKAVQELGTVWSKISLLFESRSSVAVKNRWNQLRSEHGEGIWWQYDANTGTWNQITGGKPGKWAPPSVPMPHGIMFHDGTGMTRRPPETVVYAAGSGQAQAEYLSQHPEKGPGMVISDIQSAEGLSLYPKFEEAQQTFDETDALFLSDIDASVTAIQAGTLALPFLHTGNLNRTQGPVTSDVMGDIMTRQGEAQEQGSIMTVGIYRGKKAHTHNGQHYKIEPNSSSAGYAQVNRQIIQTPPSHEETKDHGKGLEFTQENTRLLTFENMKKPVPYQDVETDDEMYDGP